MTSAVQRARQAVAERVPPRSQQSTLRDLSDARVQALTAGFVTALKDGDADALVALLTEDATWSMPALPR